MSEIDFRKKINYQRAFSYNSRQGNRDEHAIMRTFESDRGRIINSAAIRRLQQKTQVFPLERNAAVRSRLTHSLEVQQAGRYIAKEILTKLKELNLLAEYGLETLAAPFESIVEMSCLMHDIGNPPFGHFGESAINDWFCRHLFCDQQQEAAGDAPCKVPLLTDCEDDLDDLRAKIRRDLCSFEGNAQAIRLVHTLMKLNLTWAQVGCILKYTRPAWCRNEAPAAYDYLMKKPGYYLAEEEFVARLRQELDIGQYNRFPLTYIMEAADDISYCVADLEDAVEKNIFTVNQLYDYLHALWPYHEPGDLFDSVVTDALEKSKTNCSGYKSHEQFFMYLRVNTVARLVPEAADRFISHLPDIYQGCFNEPLLEEDNPCGQLLNLFKKVAAAHIFNHPEVEQLELQGYRVITGLLEIYGTLLRLSLDKFSQLAKENTLKDHPIETRLYHKLPVRFCLAYREALSKHNWRDKDFPLWEYYYRARLVQDYISGMTDLYAWDEYRRLTVAG